VESPTAYDPVHNPDSALQRRGLVLNAMAQHGYISRARARAATKSPLGLHLSTVPLQTGCTSPGVKDAAFFCDYVMSILKNNPAYKQAYAQMQTSGGLKIYTTLSARDQRAATNAVNYVVPAKKPAYNPGYNVDAEVLIQPGTGPVRAIAVDRPYGYGPGQTRVDYAVDSKYDGGASVQTGSSSKLFTLVTALKQGYPFGYSLKVHDNMTVGGFSDCHGRYVAPFTVRNADGNEGGNIPLNFGTTASINAFYVDLESHVGLCNVVKTAVSMGLHRADGSSLLKWVGKAGAPGSLPPADSLASFTLGSVNVSPMSMAAAYATIAARGVYCRPIAISRITDRSGHNLPIESAACHRVMRAGVADAANYILRGVLTNPGATAAGSGIGRPAAAKTGTANGVLRCLRGLHADPGRLRVGVQPAEPNRRRGDDRVPGHLPGLPGRLCEQRRPDVRRQRAGRDVGVHVHARVARAAARLQAAAIVLLLARHRLRAATSAEAEAEAEAEEVAWRRRRQRRPLNCRAPTVTASRAAVRSRRGPHG
jgi:membrane peptidoglycan carboxypeptidase